jgi:hypothetical protein
VFAGTDFGAHSPRWRVADANHHLDTLRHLQPDIDLAYDLVQQFAEDCFAHAPGNGSMSGSAASGRVRSAKCESLSQGSNERKRQW